MSFQQIPSSITILQSGLIGYQAISLTNFTTSAESLIAAGSSVEIAGSYFKATTDITPTATSLTAISSLTTCYLALTPSGTAGSQILTAEWQAAAPVWSDSKQGWYASAASNVRIVASMYKVASNNYSNKYLFQSLQESKKEKGINVSGFLHASNITYISTYSFLNPHMPVVGQSIILNGVITISGGVQLVATSRAERISSTTISIYGVNLTGAMATVTVTTSAVGNSGYVSLAV